MTDKRRVRMIDVAEAAGVSRTTASLVLNGRSRRIPASTKRRVFEAANALGYRANRLAQNLVRQRSELVGVVVPFVDNPFFAALIATVNRAITALGYRIIIEVAESGPDVERLEAAVDQLLDWRVDGLLHWWADIYHHDISDRIADTPTVFMASAPSFGGDSVILNAYDGERQAMRHILDLGHTRIAYLGTDITVPEIRRRAVEDAVREAGLPAPLILPCPSESPDEARCVVRDAVLQSNGPTAVMCFNDMLAFGAIRGVHDAGLRIPADISVVGFDDIWSARFTEPALTTVSLGPEEMARCAVELLIKRMNGWVEPPVLMTMEPRLIVRESTGPCTR